MCQSFLLALSFQSFRVNLHFSAILCHLFVDELRSRANGLVSIDVPGDGEVNDEDELLTDSLDVDELDVLSVGVARSRDTRRGEVRVETGFGRRVKTFEEEDDEDEDDIRSLCD